MYHCARLAIPYADVPCYVLDERPLSVAQASCLGVVVPFPAQKSNLLSSLPLNVALVHFSRMSADFGLNEGPKLSLQDPS